MADKKQKPIRQALLIQFTALVLFGGFVWLDVHVDGQLDFSVFLYLALLSIGIGLSPEAWADLIAKIFGRGDK